jgi:pimeloyl-[acyl-carrier protein] methyl ester esterase
MVWSASQCAGRYKDIPQAGHAPDFAHADAVAQALQPLLATFE